MAGASGATRQRLAEPSRESDEIRRVLIVLPYEMTARNVIDTKVASLLAQRKDLSVTFVTRSADDARLLANVPGQPLKWSALPRAFGAPAPTAPGRARRRRVALPDFRLIAGHILHLCLVYRFNSIAGFRGSRERLQQSFRLRWRAFREGLPTLRVLGMPCPRSRHLYRLLHRLLFAGWQRHPQVERLFVENAPDLLVLGHVQTNVVTPYALAARRRGVPILGLVGSWDQPTTKGPIVPGVMRLLAQSASVRDELVRHHGLPTERVSVVGWPQMDHYVDQPNEDRSKILRSLGLSPDSRYILVGAYAGRLGAHEPEMCQRLACWIRGRGACGSALTLYIRAHPQDRQWQDRLGRLHAPPTVVVEPPQRGDLMHLARLIRHAAMVIASAGTIAMDAAALDVPAIAVAFEDDSQPFYDRPSRRFHMEHYAGVVSTDAMRVVRNQADLEDAVASLLADPTSGASGRARLRDSYLAPLDGCASARIVAEITRAAAVSIGARHEQ